MIRIVRSFTRVAIVAVQLLGVLVCSREASADQSRWGAGYFPNVALTTHEGATVRFYDDLLKGKIVAIDLIYTTCKYACPLETARLAQVQRLLADRMGRDVFFYSITIDPEHDTPAVLREYAQKYKAGPGWLFLTGQREDVESISRKLGIYSEPSPADTDGHAPSLIVGNEATGQWMRMSALDNPRFLANTIGNWMNSWRTATPGRSYAEATRLAIEPGRYAFSTNCAPCHTVGGGPRIGPDLAGITRARDRQWLRRFIAAPQQLLAEGDPIAVALFDQYKPLRMPNFDLAAPDVTAIIDYIDAQSAALAGSPSAASGERRPSPGARLPASVVERMLEPYLRIQEALSADRLTGVADAARALAEQSAAAGQPAEAIRTASLGVAAADQLRGARAAFGALSEAILASARGIELGSVRVVYCPMAGKYWLQNGDEIRNPFYGRAMLDCGRLVHEWPEEDGATAGTAITAPCCPPLARHLRARPRTPRPEGRIPPAV